jgi:tetratricopeptide (TPR) repeat protein
MLSFVICAVFASYEPSLQEIEHLMSIHQYWDASFLLTHLITAHALPRYLLLRAECYLNTAQFTLSLRDTQSLVHGKVWFSSFSRSPEITVEVQPSKAEKTHAYLLITQISIALGKYKEAHSAATQTGNSTLINETLSFITLKAQAVKYAHAHEFQKAVTIYDRFAIRSPKSVDILVRRAILTSLARNHSHYAEVSSDLLQKFPSKIHTKLFLGHISFCNCSFEESDRWVKWYRTTGHNQWYEPTFLQELVHEFQTSKERLRMEIWRGQEKYIEENLTQAEEFLRSADLENAKSAVGILLTRYSKVCWKGSVFRNRLFLLHINVLKESGESNENMMKILSQYIYKSPKLADLYVERAKIHAENGELEAAKYDLKMAESLGQVKEKGKEDWHDGEEI